MNENPNNTGGTGQTTVDTEPTITSIDAPQPIGQAQDISKAMKQIRRAGNLCLIFGIITLIGWGLPYLFGQSIAAGALVYLVYAPVYNSLRLVFMIAGLLLLLSSIILSIKHKIKDLKSYIFAALGICMIFAPLIYSTVKTGLIVADPYIPSAGESSMAVWTCPDTKKAFISEDYVGTDILCALRKYNEKYERMPSLASDLDEFMVQEAVINGDARVTLNGEQPTDWGVYNILYNRTCDYYGGESKGHASIWFRVKDKDMKMGCTYFSDIIFVGI